MPRPCRPGGRARAGHRRRSGPGRRAARRPRCLHRDRRGSVRLLHPGLDRRDRGSAGAQSEPERRRDPRGTVRQPLPLHRLREDLRRRQAGRRLVTIAARTLERGRVGESVKRVDAIPKVTGEFAYSSDLFAAGMLWGHTLRSPHAHARIVEIDISEAVGMPGVHAVLTHADVPGAKTYGLEFADQPVLAIYRVRYFGEPVAVVAAEHPEQARRAAERIHVDYELLELVVAPERATQQAPVHDGRPTAGHGFREDLRPNVVRSLVIRHGDPDAQAEVSVSGVYEVGIQDQAFLGPESGLAVPDGEGGVDVYVATQWLHVDRDQVAPCLALQPEQVRIHLAGVGGAFGGREDLSMQVHGALLALHTNRPVKMVYSREESFVGHVHRHPAKIWMEHRATKAGRLVNVRARILLDGGAYASSSAAVTSNAACFAVGPYSVENALIECTCIYSNNPPCGAMRGFGAVQSCFAHEAQMDKLAAALGIDPVELRLLNALAPGDTLPTGQKVTGSFPAAEVIRRAAELPVPDAEELPRDPIRLPGGAGNTTHGQGGKRGGGSAVDVQRTYHHPRTAPLDPETGQVKGDRVHVAYMCAAMRVVVEVDVELGLTRVVWIGTAQDVGKALNPQAVHGQIEGGTAQGLGLALMEEIQTRDGLITNASFTDYLIPTTLDMPPVEAELIEEEEPDAPYGVKGVGEPPTVVSTAAVVSALRDATGSELARVPVRPDELVGL